MQDNTSTTTANPTGSTSGIETNNPNLSASELLTQLAHLQEERRQADAALAQRTSEIEDAIERAKAKEMQSKLEKLSVVLTDLGVSMPAQRALDLLTHAPARTHPMASPVRAKRGGFRAKGKGRARRLSDQEKVALFADLKSMHATGDTAAKIADRFNLSRWTVYSYMRDLKVPLPGRREPLKRAA